MDRTLIDRFSEGGPKLRRAVAGLTQQDVTRRLEPGKWSVLELVVHMADSDAIAIDRMKRILTEDNPPLLSADEDAYVERLHPHEQAMEDALALFEIGRRQWCRVLHRLPDEAFGRIGTHNVRGPMSVAQLIRMYTDHLDHHLRFVEGKRERLGKAV